MRSMSIVSLLFFNSFLLHSQQDDNVYAQKMVEANLNIISTYLKQASLDTGYKRTFAIRFLEDLTGIASNSAADYLGKTMPTADDLTRWQGWYLLNREFLSWDEKSHLIVFHKTVKPSIVGVPK